MPGLIVPSVGPIGPLWALLGWSVGPKNWTYFSKLVCRRQDSSRESQKCTHFSEFVCWRQDTSWGTWVLGPLKSMVLCRNGSLNTNSGEFRDPNVLHRFPEVFGRTRFPPKPNLSFWAISWFSGVLGRGPGHPLLALCGLYLPFVGPIGPFVGNVMRLRCGY